ncbi:MAG TPA: serine/threonine-protein kinase [Gammaproteobacteria bacterium]|nr:serine/threonine-protein kinase [Gammaproteobacteria bacterium]
MDYAEEQASRANKATPSPDPSSLRYDSFPGYVVMECIRSTGQGTVFKATHDSTNRTVAIKVTPQLGASDPTTRARYAREVEVLSQLRHPHIVRLTDGGDVDGRFYFVTDFVDGRPVDAYLREVQPKTPDLVRLFIAICEAVNAAHLRGVVHRDLKPSNILVDDQGQPHVLDFGLAKLITQAETDATHWRDMTITGQFVGTLPWSTPEQVRGADDVDIRTDVYALGVLLYHALTGQFPYDVAGSHQQVMHNILEREPARLSSTGTRVDPDLETIVLKSLNKEPERRYQSAGELARDLERYLAGDPIEAKRDSGLYVLKKYLRRYRLATLGVGAVLVLSVIYIVMLTRQSAELARVNRLAIAEREFLRQMFAAPIAHEKGPGETRVIDVLEVMARRIDTEFHDPPELRADLQALVAQFFLDLGRPKESQRYLATALDFYSDFGNRAALADVLALYGKMLSQQDKYIEAEDYCRRVLELRRQIHGSDHLQVAAALTSLAEVLPRVCQITGCDLTEAESMAREALAIRKGAGADDQLIAKSLKTLADVFVFKSEDVQAVRYYREARRMLLDAEDPNHPWILSLLNNMALSLSRLPEFYEDRALQEEVEALRLQNIELRKKRLGADHPDVAEALDNLGAMYYWLSRYEEAVEYHHQAEILRRKTRGDAHQDTVASISNRANALLALGRYTEAEPLFREAHPHESEYFGSESRWALRLLFRIARCRAGQDDLAEAQRMLRDVLPRQRKALGDTHEDTLNTWMELGDVLFQMGRMEQAHETLRQAHDIILAEFGENDERLNGLSQTLSKLSEQAKGRRD